MQKQNRFLQQGSNAIDAWEASAGLYPIIEISGDSRVFVEKHRGIQQYDPNRICISVSYGQISVTGSGMELCRMSKEQLVIRGKIESVAIIRRHK